MKIALIGYGKMGKTIEKIAIARGHEITVRIDKDNQDDFESPEFASSDVAIEFTTPATAYNNYLRAFSHGVPVVSGSTGWLADMPEVKKICDRGEATFFWTSNFSLGVNIFFALNRYLASMMEGFPQYRPSMTEIHHIHKLDHPSGTAITLAEGIMAKDDAVKGWSEAENTGDDTLRITALREGEVPGTHIISWESDVDSVTIEHKAKSREGFALGAVVAAEWSAGKKGFLTMDEMMHSLVHKSSLLDIVK
ncbi:MAG: 4-hydroxy-tetrahydrodipicolinate reductase [Muribaculum sp.]|nr:4-hydroxy-tetrahydrodipicolinate reductase [Muribaculum sp.]